VRILVTGSAGRVGRYIVSELLAAGHDVLGVDIVPPVERQGQFMRMDATLPGEVYQAITTIQAEAVIHMGAWPVPGRVPDTRTYGENVQGTFNILRASVDLGVRRVIVASSNQVYGFYDAPPVYLPVDEAHPLRPGNSYALSKAAGEQAADYFVAKYGLSVLSFRLMGVRTPAELPGEIERMQQDPASGGWLLWTRTDARDCARACRLALETADVPAGPYNITGHKVLSASAEDLVQRYFGPATTIRSDLRAHLSPMSCERAADAFGYQPQYLWSATQPYPE
jgi:nucleoside-diphosphate-sugar epimerase